MEDRILYIHGFNGSPNGTTGTFIKNFFKDAIIIAPELDLLDYDNTISKLKDIIKDNTITIVVGHSLGAFYTLALNTDEAFKIVINPCLYPSIEIPKLCPLANEWIEKISTAEKILYTHITGLIRQTTFASFSDNDELFSYKTVFDEIYGASGIKNTRNSIAVEGTHHISSQSLEIGLAAAMEYGEKLASVVRLWPL